MKFKHISIVLILVITAIFILASCVKMQYPYKGINYDKPDIPLAGLKAEYELYVSKITPTTKPVGGVMVVRLPSVAYIKNNFVSYKGPKLSAKIREDWFSYMANQIFYELRYYFGEAIEKRRIFDKVTFVISDDPIDASSGGDFTMFTRNLIFYLASKNDPAKSLAIVTPSSALPPVDRLILWLDRVEKAARVGSHFS